jgi:hypothetical protein
MRKGISPTTHHGSGGGESQVTRDLALKHAKKKKKKKKVTHTLSEKKESLRIVSMPSRASRITDQQVFTQLL